MAAKKFDTSSLMKNFIPAVPSETENTPPKATIKPVAPVTTSRTPATPTVIEKESTKAITFHMPESVNMRLLKYLYSKKLAGEKITITQIINEAILKYMDKLGI